MLARGSVRRDDSCVRTGVGCAFAARRRTPNSANPDRFHDDDDAPYGAQVADGRSDSHSGSAGAHNLSSSPIPDFEPAARQYSETLGAIGGNIADLRRVGKSGSGLSLPDFYDLARLHAIICDPSRSIVAPRQREWMNSLHPVTRLDFVACSARPVGHAEISVNKSWLPISPSRALAMTSGLPSRAPKSNPVALLASRSEFHFPAVAQMVDFGLRRSKMLDLSVGID